MHAVSNLQTERIVLTRELKYRARGGTTQRRYDKRAPGSAWGGACGYNLSHDQLSSVDQQYTIDSRENLVSMNTQTVILTKLGLGKRDIADIRPRYL